MKRIQIKITLCMLTVLFSCNQSNSSTEFFSNTQVKEDCDSLKAETSLFQMILDLDELKRYYHFDSNPNRLPFQVKKNGIIQSDCELLVGGQQALIVERELVEDDSIFVFTNLTRNNEETIITFDYLDEGVFGECRFEKAGDCEWKMTMCEIAEY